jgi:hypothetical protein
VSGRMVTGKRAIGLVITAIVATAVLPPAGAWWLNARRVAVTTDRVQEVVVSIPVADTQVLCGPGRLPDSDVMGANEIHAAWISAAVSRPEAFGGGMPTDGWGRCFLANERWILSAGPNGVVDTALGADRLVGDDIGVRRSPQ